MPIAPRVSRGQSPLERGLSPLERGLSPLWRGLSPLQFLPRLRGLTGW